MHIGSDPVSLLFGLVVFALFCAKLWEYYNKYLRSFFTRRLDEVKNEEIELWEKESLLKTTRKRLENQLVQQKLQFIVLDQAMQRYAVWQKAQLQTEQAQQQLIAERLSEKRHQQAAFFNQSMLLQAALRAAMLQASTKLAAQYKCPDGAGQLCKIINHLT